jgi:hypothetical protein
MNTERRPRARPCSSMSTKELGHQDAIAAGNSRAVMTPVTGRVCHEDTGCKEAMTTLLVGTARGGREAAMGIRSHDARGKQSRDREEKDRDVVCDTPSILNYKAFQESWKVK